MKFLFLLITIFGAAFGGWWITTRHPEIVHRFENLINKTELNTLELRFSAQHIMNAHRRELLKDKRHQYLTPHVKFYPYLLMEIKYSITDRFTGEGVMLWDLVDGEMVINARNWEKTHGFGDCINTHATRDEFKILNILARRGGSIDRAVLSKTLRVENEILDAWVDSCRKKNLIVQMGNRYRLHLQRPHLDVLPETKLERKLVTQPMKNAIKIGRRYSPSQILRITRSAFGNHFTIRKTTLVYLPVHSIQVKNPDGSIHTSHWNALNGKLLDQAHFID